MGNDSSVILTLDSYDCISYIVNKTGCTIDDVSKILDAENDYMMKHGILHIDDGK